MIDVGLLLMNGLVCLMLRADLEKAANNGNAIDFVWNSSLEHIKVR